MKSETTFLFGDDRIVTAVSGRSEFQHSFGGPPDRRGAAREDCNGMLIHLLHRLDLSDPAIPIAIPGIRWLPLYYCFDFRTNDLGYRLISDDELVTFFPEDDPNVSNEESWPSDEVYPLEFPTSSIQIAKQDYDPTDVDDALNWSGIFGIGKLSKDDQATVKERVAKEIYDLGYYAPESDEEFEEALHLPFMQGKPDGACLNPECSNREKKGTLTTIALMPAEPVEGIHTFGPWGSGVDLIFQLCPLCYTIRVSNQSS